MMAVVSSGRGKGIFATLSLSIAMVMALMFVPATSASGSTGQNGPLRAASGLTAGETITLDSLTACDVFDGLTIMKNTGTIPIRIDRVNAVIPTEITPARDKITYQLRSFPQGSTTGAVGAVENMPVLDGHILGSAVGGVLQPVASKSLWYVVLFRMRVMQPRASEWVIRGLHISYTVGHRTFSAELRQTVRLPRTNC
jgi:hypothetical protein